MKRLYPVTLIFLLPCLFCQLPTKPENNPDNSQPGYFSLALLQGLQKTSIANTSAAKGKAINLGDLHSTTSYYFLLSNSGGNAITNIHLSVSDSSFQIFPTLIDTLKPGLGQSLVPVIKLTAIHGTGIQGLGSEPLMSPGPHQVQIIVSGLTISNNIVTTVSLLATATVNALVMNIDVHASLQKIDLFNPPLIEGCTQFDGISICNMWGYLDTTDSIITIKNTGNVNLNIKEESYSDPSDSSKSRLVKISDSTKFIVKSGFIMVFRLDGNNTISNPRELPLQSDGNAYFIIQH